MPHFPPALFKYVFSNPAKISSTRALIIGKDDFISDGNFVSKFINQTSDFVLTNVQDQISRDQRVTYGTLDTVLRDMGQFMASQNAFFEADFNIFDGQWGQVGYGSLVGSHFA